MTRILALLAALFAMTLLEVISAIAGFMRIDIIDAGKNHNNSKITIIILVAIIVGGGIYLS